MGSMSPKKYIIVIDMEYLAKRNKLGDQLFSFMHDNFTTAKLFLGSSKMDAVLTNTKWCQYVLQISFRKRFTPII